MGKLGSDQAGFSAVEGLLILVITGILGSTGFYVYKARQNIDNNSKSASVSSQTQNNSPKNKKLSSEYSGTTVYATNNKFGFVVPDGWNVIQQLQYQGAISDMFLAGYEKASDLTYNKGVKAIIQKVNGGRDGFVGFAASLDKISDSYYKSKIPTYTYIGQFQSNNITWKKYSTVEPPSNNEGIGLPQGTKTYIYYTEKGNENLTITYDVQPGFKDDSEFIDKVVKTFVLN